MIDAIVSAVLEQLISFAAEEIKGRVSIRKQVNKLSSNLRAIQAVLIDAEQRQVNEVTVRDWLDKLKHASYDMEDLLDGWITAKLKLQIEAVDEKKVFSFFPSRSFGFKRFFAGREIAHKIKEINENLDSIAQQKDMFNFHVNVISNSSQRSERVPSISLVDDSQICGRNHEKNSLISKLLCESSEEGKPFHVISILGMGGIGKTTLAQLACNDAEVKRNFEKIIWVCVSDHFEELRIARAIVEDLEGSAPNLNELQSLMRHIQESITGKKFLLVLDDVWTEDYNKWEPFFCCLRNGLQGSKILITTRKEIVANTLGSIDIISIKELAEEECWSLFKRLAFFGRSVEECEKLVQMGRKIAGKCKGLPLAAKTIGSLLRFKKTEEEWKRILDSEMWKLQEFEKGLLAPMLLSYNDLPFMVKRCFSYCAIFPKDYNMEKDELIKLWMAQGYFSSEENKEMEIIGQECFDILATRSFFQEFQTDDTAIITRCKMHDIVHDFAQFLSKNECSIVEANGHEESFTGSFRERVRHAILTLGEGASFPIYFCRFKSLRSLLIGGESVEYSSLNNVLPKLFNELTRLRALDLSKSWLPKSLIQEIPKDVGKLIHLRYLNLAGHRIQRLPEALCELCNLQTLNVNEYEKLKELPQGIGKLIKLRHLLNHLTVSLHYMPAGIARLTSLRTLKRFVVGKGIDGSKTCALESLKNLNLLQECCICGLGNVSDVGDAKRSELAKKKNLLDLGLSFDQSEEAGKRKNEEDEELLEALQPHLNLNQLRIYDHRGNNIFPSWMMSLTSLRVLGLYGCKNCEHLPPLGKLPSLEQLDIWLMHSVNRVGNEFLGIESGHDAASSSSSPVIAFPKLKSLKFVFMNNWEEWDYSITREAEIMPRLSYLTIQGCPKLKAMPDYFLQTTTLQTLTISGSPILEERYAEGMGEDWQKISHIPNVVIY